MAAEAEIEEGASGGGAASKRGLNKKMLIIIGAAVGLLLALGVGGYVLFFSAPAEKSMEEVAPETFIFNLPTMTVNLKREPDENQQFMKLSVAIEVASEDVMIEIQPRMAKVVDAFQVYLRELRRSDLEGSAGIYRLREELRRRINIAIFPAQIESILFREILVQ